jgi:membrane protease YdiL (CAAX protease family)
MENRKNLRDVNYLFLVVLLLQLINAFLYWIPQYVRLTINQVLFVLIPSLLFLRAKHENIRERVRWHFPDWKVLLLSLLLGISLYPLSAASAGVLQQVLGYTNFQLPPDATPRMLFDVFFVFLSFAILAPICEEILFRGILQPVYEKKFRSWGAVITSLLFIAFHLSLLQGLNIVVLALVLGLINYRTRSLPASILNHFGANVMAALVISSAVLNLNIEQFIFAPLTLLASLPVSMIVFLLFMRLTKADPQTAVNEEAHLTSQLKKLAAWIPLLIAAPLILFVIGAEFVVSRQAAPPPPPLTIHQSPWQQARQWQYDIVNAADDVVGEGTCELTPEEEVIDLLCSASVVAYEITVGNSLWSNAGGERTDHVRWQAETGQLMEGSTRYILPDQAILINAVWTVQEKSLITTLTTSQDGEQVIELPRPTSADDGQEGSLIFVSDASAPFQLAAMEFKGGTNGAVYYFNPFTWRPETSDNGPLIEPRTVDIMHQEKIIISSSRINTWKATLGRQTFWYDVKNLLPVQFTSGIETWTVK